MKFKRTLFFFTMIFFAILAPAQEDNLQLACPLSDGTLRIIRPSDKDYQRSSEYGVMLTSKSDTLVQAVHEASVVIVARTDDSKYDVVLLYKNYYFWYAGVIQPKVKTGTKVKVGTPIGSYKPGDLIELLMYKQEEPINPRKYLKCK